MSHQNTPHPSEGFPILTVHSKISDLQNSIINDARDELGNLTRRTVKYLLKASVSLTDFRGNTVIIPEGSIIEKMHSMLVAVCPDGTKCAVDVKVNDDVELAVTHIETAPIEDEKFPALAWRVGLTRKQISLVAAIIGADLATVFKNTDVFFDPAKNLARADELALTKKVNDLFEAMFINGYSFKGITTVGGKVFIASKHTGSHGNVSFVLVSENHTAVEFRNMVTGQKPIEKNPGWNGLREWDVQFEGEYIDKLDGWRLEKYNAAAFPKKNPLEILLEALENFQVSDPEARERMGTVEK